ncbi:SRPBCC family protein [Agilicoccus flavus]|uniref:SRPBCC family protein n=1 Tax=Agilicoccus flavus TaxID=2775968 RepID=UPI001CF64116|nr:SRPBCC family protein [Agilicoccus flavus]
METNAVHPVEAGPRKVARRARVAAPAHELFALVANPHRHHEVDGSGTVRPEVIGPRELRLGDRFQVAMRMGPLPYRMTSTVTALEPDRVVEWQHPGGHRWRWEFEPQADETTLVTEVFDYSTSRVPALLERLKAPQRNARSIEAGLVALQRAHGS